MLRWIPFFSVYIVLSHQLFLVSVFPVSDKISSEPQPRAQRHARLNFRRATSQSAPLFALTAWLIESQFGADGAVKRCPLILSQEAG